ncbi:hypothetical protein RJT34_19515 [Clitoria ternatea]|uniref:START domain-containing protein n=1 Tax=Clitoria ternatea TaxID=43366 RepID=A0AAN9P3V0_CLITE
MAKKGNIVQYRERLDKTLSSPDLTDEQILKTHVKSQLKRSSNVAIEGNEEKLVETRTVELCNLLDMLRSASVDNSGGSSASQSDWKIKQDKEECRVMYREGPAGTPFHTLLVEGYVEGPLDVALCLSWDSSLYKKWWPQFTIPSFKVLVSDCLQRVQTWEQIALVRMKVPWPLSTREAIVNYYLFEYFQDDSVVVLLKSVPESKNIDGLKDAIPEAKDVVRMDVVGGYVMQKVSSERSYFRIIANLDIKLDLVPASLINFISRQILGSGFKLYQKAVASKMGHDKEFSKALEDTLYVRIREAILNNSGSNTMDDWEELKQVARFVPAEECIPNKQDEAKDTHLEDSNNQYADNYNGEVLDAGSEKIVQIEEDVNKVHGNPIEEGDSLSVVMGKKDGEILDADIGEIAEANNQEIVEADNKEIVEANNQEIVEISDKEIVETNNEEIVEANNEESVEANNEEIVEAGNEEIAESINEEIAEANNEEIVQIEKDVIKIVHEHGIPIKGDDARSILMDTRNVYIRSDVKRAVETIEKVISVVRECGLQTLRSTPNFADGESHCMEKGGTVDSHSARLIQLCLENEVSFQVSSRNVLEETSEEEKFRGQNPNLKEVNHYNKVVPASPEQNLSRSIEACQVDSYSLKNGTTLDEINSEANHDISSDDLNRSSRDIKYRFCCFLY